MLSIFARPKPQYEPGQTVEILESSPHIKSLVNCFLNIKTRRWVRPIGMTDKQWVYDGEISEKTLAGPLVHATFGYCWLESSLGKVLEPQ